MNIAIAPPKLFDIRDWIVMVLLASGFVASWGYVFVHPSDAAFGICMGGQGTFVAAFHWMTVRDDKSPDMK
jgi:hypothetical protein